MLTNERLAKRYDLENFENEVFNNNETFNAITYKANFISFTQRAKIESLKFFIV